MTLNIVNLNIAELIVDTAPIVVCTVLGSCVSVCLYSESTVGGGIIHYALPEAPENHNDHPLRYGDFAIADLIQKTSSLLKTPPKNLKAKIVGGAAIKGSSDHLAQRVGAENIKIAKALLEKAQIPIIGLDVGGHHGRKVLFHFQTGRLQVAYVGPGFSRPSASVAATMPKTKTKY